MGMTMIDGIRVSKYSIRVSKYRKLLKELPNSVRNALSIRVNAEKDTMVATRIVQRWRKPSNPISNTVGSISDSKIDFLISALYADKLPLKVVELIRKMFLSRHYCHFRC